MEPLIDLLDGTDDIYQEDEEEVRFVKNLK